MAEYAAAVETRIDPNQWDAHQTLRGVPEIIVGGPGTGKTQFLCERVAAAINDGRCAPDQSIMLTFSRRGTVDLRRRLVALLGSGGYRINVSTYHSLAMRIVEAHATALGWRTPPTVLAGAEQEKFILDLMADEDPAAWHPAFRPMLTSSAMASEVTEFVLRCGEHLHSPEDIANQDRDQWRGLPEFLARYDRALIDAGRTDYGRLLADAARGIETIAEIGDHYTLVVADEYQDTSPAQSRLLLGLAADTTNLFVAADPYQSIYSFRGTDLDNVFSFPQETERLLGIRAERLVLTTSFRVPERILASAVSVTARELPGGAGKVLSERSGGRVDAHIFPLMTEEADWIAADIERVHLADGVPLEHIAVFVRASGPFVDSLSHSLERRGISHTHEESRLTDQPIVSFVLDLVDAVCEQDDDAARRVLLSPYIGITPGAMIGMEAEIRLGESWPSVIRDSVPEGASLAELLEDREWATDRAAPNGLWHLWTSLPQMKAVATDAAHTDDRHAWSAFAQSLDRFVERSPNASLHEHARFVRDTAFEADPLLDFDHTDEAGVTISTLHRSKGTEFDVVYVADAVEGRFPDLRTTDSLLGSRHLNPHLPVDAAEYRLFRLDEERRLAYTAMTRASARVVWTASTTDGDADVGPSRFIPLVAEVSQPTSHHKPLTRRSFEAQLRNVLMDPDVQASHRLAAAKILAEGPEHGLADPLVRYGVLEHGDDTGLIPKDLRLSPSQATSYLNCPRRYAVERYVMTRSEETEAMRFGSLIHKVLEETEKAAVSSGDQRGNLDDAILWLDSVWDEHGFGDDAVGSAWRRRATTVLDNMYRLWPSSARTVGLETPLEASIGGTPWLGRADRIEARGDVVYIVDYKTGGKALGLDEAAVSIQLGYYTLAASETPDITRFGSVEGAEFWYPRIPLKSSISTRSFDMASLPEVRQQMEEISESIRAEEFTPIPGPDCSRCPVELVCPARALGREAFA